MKTVIIYHSKTGTTKKYAEEIEAFLQNKGNEVIVSSIKEYSGEMLKNADYLFMGCWTNGLFFFLQHPDNEWVEFAKRFKGNGDIKIAFFATYKILTGSMFKNMYKHLKGKVSETKIKLKSKHGLLSENDKSIIEGLLN